MKNKYISGDLLGDKPKWVGCDFDNTIAKRIWPEEGIGEEMPGALDALRALQFDGWKICVYTARGWADYIALDTWFKDHKFKPDHIILGKPFFKLYIGDEAYRFTDWETDLPKIDRLLNEKRTE